MLNLFIDNLIWLHTIIVTSIILVFVSIIFRLTKHWCYSDRTDMRFFGSLFIVLIIAFFGFLSENTISKDLQKQNAENVIIQNFTISTDVNKGLLDEKTLILKKTKDNFYDQNILLQFFKPLKKEVKFVVLKQNDKVIELQNASGDVLKVTEKKYPKLWKSLTFHLKTEKIKN